MLVREQRHICGKTEQQAGYMEVDLYEITAQQHKASRRAKRQEATSLAMQTYNENRAKRYLVQLTNTNFRAGDFSWTGTYDDEHLPGPEDRERADQDWTNYIKRLYRLCDKRGIRRPKWVEVTEYTTVQEDGTYLGRHHHHAIIEHVPGLDRDTMETLWRKGKSEKLGFCRCEYVQADHNSVESLARYITKNRRCARRWRQSQGLEKTKRPRPNDTKWSRKRLREASTLYIDDRAFWAKQYPGWTLERVEADVSPGGMWHTVVILWRQRE